MTDKQKVLLRKDEARAIMLCVKLAKELELLETQRLSEFLQCRLQDKDSCVICGVFVESQICTDCFLSVFGFNFYDLPENLMRLKFLVKNNQCFVELPQLLFLIEFPCRHSFASINPYDAEAFYCQHCDIKFETRTLSCERINYKSCDCKKISTGTRCCNKALTQEVSSKAAFSFECSKCSNAPILCNEELRCKDHLFCLVCGTNSWNLTREGNLYFCEEHVPES